MKKEGFKKGQKHPQKEQPENLGEGYKTAFRLWVGSQPTGWEQRLSIWITVVFTLLTGYFACMSYNAQVDIKGMKEVLNTFNANVRYVPKKIFLKGDTITLTGFYKNYGTRMADSLTTSAYFVSENYIYEVPLNTLEADILPSEHYYFNIVFIRHEIPDSEVMKGVIAVKVKYKDPTTQRVDSVYTFGSRFSYDKSDSNTVAVANADEIKFARKRIKQSFPEIRF